MLDDVTFCHVLLFVVIVIAAFVTPMRNFPSGPLSNYLILSSSINTVYIIDGLLNSHDPSF